MRIATQCCGDCGFDLPLKQFASYRGKRHTLCRTCLAVDVAEFKAYVLPFVQERREAGEAPWHWEDWEIAVLNRIELTGYQQSAMTLRSPKNVRHRLSSQTRGARYYDPAVIRPWKHAVYA